MHKKKEKYSRIPQSFFELETFHSLKFESTLT